MTTMRMRSLATLSMLAALVACGSDSATEQPPSALPSTTSVATPPHERALAQRVTLVRGGGLMGGKLTLHFAADQPPPDGFTRADVTAVLTAAADPALEKPLRTPRNVCCDRYVYGVTVLLSDGTSHTFTVVEGARQPPAVARLLHLMAT